MDSYSPFVIYSNIYRELTAKGYGCVLHKDYIAAVRDNSPLDFYSLLSGATNHFIEETRESILDLNHYEKLISVWKRTDRSRVKDNDYNLLVYFSTPQPNNKKVTKQEAINAYRYLIALNHTALLFVHGQELIPAACSHLKDKQYIPSTINYSINVIQASKYDIEVSTHICVPKHTLIKNSDSFYESEGLQRGKLPKISFEDPAIQTFGCEIGDIARIERTEDYDEMSSIFYREVGSIPMDVHKKK